MLTRCCIRAHSPTSPLSLLLSIWRMSSASFIDLVQAVAFTCLSDSAAQLLPLRWWTQICTYLFIYAPLRLKCDRKEELCVSELGLHNTNGAVSSCHKWTWTCVSVSSLPGRRCRSTMWRQVCSTREITWTARCLTATATCWPASLWRSSLVRFLFVLSPLKLWKTNHWRLPFRADKAQSYSFLGWPIFPATSVSSSVYRPSKWIN